MVRFKESKKNVSNGQGLASYERGLQSVQFMIQMSMSTHKQDEFLRLLLENLVVGLLLRLRHLVHDLVAQGRCLVLVLLLCRHRLTGLESSRLRSRHPS